jgi:hypothetical protein
LKVDTAGVGVVSQAGATLLVETVGKTGLDRALSSALGRWRASTAIHDPGKILCDLAVSVALGGDCLADVAAVRAEPEVFGLVASDPTVSRLIDTLARDEDKALAAVDAARARARAGAWALAGEHAPDHGVDAERPLIVDLDATLLDAHSEKENAAPTFKKGFGFQCAMRRSVVSPVQPGGTWKEVPGSDDLP